jgi:hypothetical protein
MKDHREVGPSEAEKMRTRYLLFFLFVLLLIYLYSCKKEEPEVGTLKISLTDAPGDFQAVNLEIKKVKLHSNLSHPEADWIEMETQAGIYDMIGLSTGKDTLLASGELPTGPYHHLRIELGSRNTVVVNGGTFPLNVPGSKIEIPSSTNINENEERHLLVDIDVRASIVKDSAGNYTLYPAVRVADVSSTGSIRGIVDPATNGCKVYAIAGFDTIGSYAAPGGEFKILGLAPGMYRVTAVPPAPVTPGSVPNVAVTAGEVKDIGTVQVGQ